MMNKRKAMPAVWNLTYHLGDTRLPDNPSIRLKRIAPPSSPGIGSRLAMAKDMLTIANKCNIVLIPAFLISPIT
jgi:hypothetical protein